LSNHQTIVGWARRKEIHEEVYQSPASSHKFINRFIADLEILPKTPGKALVAARFDIVRPKAPPAGYAKVHVDAAVAKIENRGEAAAMCRDTDGNYMGSSTLVVHGITDVATLEAIAC
jgi:hypothetical protein